ncbi:MAG: lipoyl(octanoyl) transferase LipB [Chloroflexi bacterium]|nr:lipoyl(octanoyl) transferase LipB [Chloroflexota bacterium]MCL5075051.1 lipoyl(octanoyl) transferase LipB [Chloroflexota bacterium]
MTKRRCLVLNLGLVEYRQSLALQERLVEERRADRIDNLLLLLQHPPVITIGRRGHKENILASPSVLDREGITICETNRGGDVTYHGPGQLVGYPILRLADYACDPLEYLRRLETVIIRALSHWGIEARQVPGYTGVWIGESKVAAIGIAIRHGITMHGFALNVNTNLDHFALIVPCGLNDKAVTSMAAYRNQKVDFTAVMEHITEHFGQGFGAEMVNLPVEDAAQYSKNFLLEMPL